MLSFILGLYITAENINQDSERFQYIIQNDIENQERNLQDENEEKPAEGEPDEAKGEEEGGEKEEAEPEDEAKDEAEDDEKEEEEEENSDEDKSEEENSDNGSSESSSSPSSSSESSSESEESEESESEESSSTEEEDEVPKVEFKKLNNFEHLRNFRAISGNLKAYEEEYLDCLAEVPTPDFNAEAIDECVGRNFVKVLIDIKYVTMKTMAVGDSKAREYFIKGCFDHAVDNEEFLTGCDILERDVLNMLWTGLTFVEIVEANKDKYLSEYAKIPEAVFEDLWDEIKPFAHDFFELLDEIDAHKEVTVVRLKNYIDDRYKMKQELENAAEFDEVVDGPVEEPVEEPAEEPVTNEKVDFEEKYKSYNFDQNEEETENNDEPEDEESPESEEERRRNLLSKLHTTKRTRGVMNGNRFLNVKTLNNKVKKHFMDASKIDNLYLMGQVGGKNKPNSADDRRILLKGRTEFMKAQLEKLKHHI